MFTLENQPLSTPCTTFPSAFDQNTKRRWCHIRKLLHHSSDSILYAHCNNGINLGLQQRRQGWILIRRGSEEEVGQKGPDFRELVV